MNAYYASLIRGAIGGLFSAGVMFFASASTQGALTAGYLAGGAFCAYMVARFGEGTYDANRSKS